MVPGYASNQEEQNRADHQFGQFNVIMRETFSIDLQFFQLKRAAAAS
jgi:hypothetical protein